MQKKRRKRSPKPLDEDRLYELAVAYAARFATSSAKLGTYLNRKLYERGWAGETEPDVDALVARFVHHGFVDDAAYARMKADSLLRRGYGARRIGQALHHAGIEETLRHETSPDEAAERTAAFALAKRRRFGPFGDAASDPKKREKQLAALVRAGHSFDSARMVVDAGSVDVLEDWVAQASPEE